MKDIPSDSPPKSSEEESEEESETISSESKSELNSGPKLNNDVQFNAKSSGQPQETTEVAADITEDIGNLQILETGLKTFMEANYLEENEEEEGKTLRISEENPEMLSKLNIQEEGGTDGKKCITNTDGNYSNGTFSEQQILSDEATSTGNSTSMYYESHEYFCMDQTQLFPNYQIDNQSSFYLEYSATANQSEACEYCCQECDCDIVEHNPVLIYQWEFMEHQMYRSVEQCPVTNSPITTYTSVGESLQIDSVNSILAPYQYPTGISQVIVMDSYIIQSGFIYLSHPAILYPSIYAPQFCFIPYYPGYASPMYQTSSTTYFIESSSSTFINMGPTVQRNVVSNLEFGFFSQSEDLLMPRVQYIPDGGFVTVHIYPEPMSPYYMFYAERWSRIAMGMNMPVFPGEIQIPQIQEGSIINVGPNPHTTVSRIYAQQYDTIALGPDPILIEYLMAIPVSARITVLRNHLRNPLVLYFPQGGSFTIGRVRRENHVPQIIGYLHNLSNPTVNIQRGSVVIVTQFPCIYPQLLDFSHGGSLICENPQRRN